jgi:APA family basic amino acid/polyamine antiporter
MELFGPLGGTLVKVGIIISVIGAANGFLMSGSRVAFHLADLGTLPFSSKLAMLNANQSPANATILVGFLACVYSLSGEFNLLTDLAVFSCWIFYTLTFYCVIVLRKKMPDAERKYKVPCYPVIPIIAIASGVYVIVSQLFLSGMKATLMSVASIAITLIGLPVYLAVRKKNVK